MTLTYFDLFYSKVKFSYLGFSVGNVKIVDFSEIISPIDLKEGRSRHLIEFMKVCEIESECHFLTLAKVMYIQIVKPDFLRNYCAVRNKTVYESFQVGNENWMT